MKAFVCVLVTLVAIATATLDHVAYLKQFNYLTADHESLAETESDMAMTTALEAFQSMFNIEITGEMNSETLAAMELPRCGVADVDSESPKQGVIVHNNGAPYVTRGEKWTHSVITYRVMKYTKDLSRSFVDQAIIKALKMWTDVTPLTFRKLHRGHADIEISFVVGEHGDNYPFDGPGKTLAHAFFPRADNKLIRGDAHFDDAELWLEKGRGAVRHSYNLVQVMTHEFGHSLGLHHSKTRPSVMAPHYQKYDVDFKLFQDDIDGIQSLYGKPHGYKTTTEGVETTTTTDKTTTTPVKTTTTDDHSSYDKCFDAKLDAVTMSDDGNAYGFRGFHFYKFNEKINTPVATQSISDVWKGLPNYLDAALYWPARQGKRSAVYFFKGSKYYRFEKQRLVAGYPKDISCGFPGVPDNLDTAFVEHNSGVTYFVKGNYVYKYKRGSHGSRAQRIERRQSVFRHLRANPVEAAFTWYRFKHTYYFSGNQYYRLHKDMTSNSRYPRKISTSFLGCKNSMF